MLAFPGLIGGQLDILHKLEGGTISRLNERGGGALTIGDFITGATTVGGLFGIYELGDTTPRPIATRTTPIPGAGGATFNMFADSVRTRGDTTVFRGDARTNPGNSYGGVYIANPAGLGVAADTRTIAPDGSLFRSFTQSSFDGETVAFTAATINNTFGVYTRSSAGEITLIAGTGSTVAGRPLTAADGLVVDGDNYVFHGSSSGPGVALFAHVNGVTRIIAETGVPLPDGTPYDLGDVTIDDGIVLFRSNNALPSIWAALPDGSLIRVARALDVVGDAVLGNVYASSDPIDGNRVAFYAQITVGTVSREAYYVATIPAPSSLGFAGAAAFVAAYRRRRT